MGFIFSSKKEKLVAIFDIGSGSVGGALVKIPNNKNSLPSIITSARTDIVNRKDVDFTLFLNDMILALGFTVRSLLQSKLGAPDEVHCVLASPWYLSETRMIRMNKEHSFVFSNKTVDELLKKEIENLTNNYKNKYGNVDSTPLVIEHPIVSVSLNGYHIDDPIGKKTRSVEMNMIISLSPKICIDKISEAISKVFHHITISFSSFMVSSYIAVREKYITNDSYLLIDIGGEVTDIGIIYKGILKESLSFPFGKKTLFREISKKLKVELRDSYEKFNLYNKGVLVDKEKDKFAPILESIGNSWGQSFGDCLNNLPRILTLPGTVFLTIDDDIKEWFVKVIKDEDHIKSMTVNNTFNIISLDGPEFLHICDIKSGACDPFLMIEAINVMKKI